MKRYRGLNRITYRSAKSHKQVCLFDKIINKLYGRYVDHASVTYGCILLRSVRIWLFHYRKVNVLI